MGGAVVQSDLQGRQPVISIPWDCEFHRSSGRMELETEIFVVHQNCEDNPSQFITYPSQ